MCARFDTRVQPARRRQALPAQTVLVEVRKIYPGSQLWFDFCDRPVSWAYTLHRGEMALKGGALAMHS